LEELQRRNYSQETTRSYIHAVKQFAEYFGKSPQELGAEEIRRYQLYLLNEKKYSAGTVKVHMSALRFLYKKVLKRRDLSFDDLVYPKKPKKLPVVLSPEEVGESKSGDNKGTIRSGKWHLVVSRDVRQHRLISTDYITSLPCHGRGREFESRRPRHSFQKSCFDFVETNEGAKGHVCPFCTLFRQLERFSRLD